MTGFWLFISFLRYHALHQHRSQAQEPERMGSAEESESKGTEGGKEMIECPNCHAEYRGSIPKHCMECGTKLPEKKEGEQK